MKINNNTSELKVTETLIYLKNRIVKELGLAAGSMIRFIKIDRRWYIYADNQEGKGVAVYQMENQMRVTNRNYLKKLRELTGVKRSKPLTFQVDFNSMSNNGQILFPLTII